MWNKEEDKNLGDSSHAQNIQVLQYPQASFSMREKGEYIWARNDNTAATGRVSWQQMTNPNSQWHHKQESDTLCGKAYKFTYMAAPQVTPEGKGIPRNSPRRRTMVDTLCTHQYNICCYLNTHWIADFPRHLTHACRQECVLAMVWKACRFAMDQGLISAFIKLLLVNLKAHPQDDAKKYRLRMTPSVQCRPLKKSTHIAASLLFISRCVHVQATLDKNINTALLQNEHSWHVRHRPSINGTQKKS